MKKQEDNPAYLTKEQVISEIKEALKAAAMAKKEQEGQSEQTGYP